MFLELILLSSLLFSGLPAISGTTSQVPLYFDFPLGYASYSGVFDTNTSVISLKPALKVVMGPMSISKQLCGILVHHDAQNVFPFIIRVTNATSGLAEMHVSQQSVSPQSARDVFVFQIEARDCDDPPHFSERVYVTLRNVATVNSQRAVMSHVMRYDLSVLEMQPLGSLVGHVGQAAICEYTIESPPDAPFYVESPGVLRTKKVLHFRDAAEYQLVVRSTSCKNTKDTFVANVVVKVEKSCVPGWDNFPSSSVSIRAGQQGFVSLWGPQESGVSAWPALDMCGLECQSRTIRAIVKLTPGYSTSLQDDSQNFEREPLAFTSPQLCAFDEQALQMQRTVCGVSPHTVELLPRPDDFLQHSSLHGGGSVHSLTSSLIFDGQSTFWRVEDDHIPANHILGASFTMSFWMRRAASSTVKEQILCNADGESAERHYSLYIENCSLVLNWRHEFEEGYTLAPKQWTFGGAKMQALLCPSASAAQDSTQWHHFGIVKTAGNEVELFVDGDFWQEAPTVVSSADSGKGKLKVTYTILSVGACFHGPSGKYVEYLHADLAGFTLLRDSTETSSAMHCLANCGELLTILDLDRVMRTGTSVSLAKTQVEVTSSNVSHVARVLAAVNYANTDKKRRYENNNETRNLLLQTTVICKNANSVGSPEVNLPVQMLRVVLTGTGNVIWLEALAPSQVTGEENGNGIPFLDGLSFIISNASTSSLITPESVQLEILTSCVLRVSSELDVDREALTWNTALADSLAIRSVNGSLGLVLDGHQTVANYLRVLQTVRYSYQFQLLKSGQKELAMVDRTIGVQCAQRNEHVILEKFVKVTLINMHSPNGRRLSVDDPMAWSGEGNAGEGSLNDRPLNGHLAKDNTALKHVWDEKVSHSVKGVTTVQVVLAVVLSLCGLFFLVMLVLLVVTMWRRRAHRYNSPHRRDDCRSDAALNASRPIVLYRNPMELQQGESLVEFGLSAKSQETPFCPVDMETSLIEEDESELMASGSLTLQQFEQEDTMEPPHITDAEEDEEEDEETVSVQMAGMRRVDMDGVNV